MLDSSILYKSYVYNAKGSLEKEDHFRFNCKIKLTQRFGFFLKRLWLKSKHSQICL
jgi:hypothetical protein